MVKDEQLMKNYYAKFKGKCYAFNDEGGGNAVVDGYGFELMTVGNCPKRVVKCRVVPLETRDFLSEVTR